MAQAMTATKLKACPFCGSTHASEHSFKVKGERPGILTWEVRCWISAGPDFGQKKYGCGANTGDQCTKMDAIKAWNRRAK